jgi:Cytochrome c554 and c-prime
MTSASRLGRGNPRLAGEATLGVLLAYSTLACGSSSSAQGPTYFTKDQLMDPQTCKECHQQYYDDWSASMHAYSSDDPLFVAMNQRGQDQAQVGTFCVNCHAPMAVKTGKTTDGTNLASLPQSLKGVTCYYCHTVDGLLDPAADAAPFADDSLHFADDGVMRASFHDPVQNKAHRSAYSSFHDGSKIDSANFCGSCHDVVNGHGAHIERTFAEWNSTVYKDVGAFGNTCGQCHMHKSTGVAANAPGVFVRSLHDHKFPGVDLPLVAIPGADPQQADLQKQAVTDFLNTELQTVLCVAGLTGAASIFVVADNVGAGHSWPSGAAQDRRAWFEIVASVGGSPIYQSGVVPAGTDPTDLSDPDLWLLRDCLLDGDGNLVHTFWGAASSDSNTLPGQKTSDPTDPRYYQTHVMQTYPRTGSKILSAYPDTVTLKVHLLAFPPDLFDDLFTNPAEIGLSAADVQGLRSNLAPLDVGTELTWTQAAAGDALHGGTMYFDQQQGVPVYCVSKGASLNPQADKVPAPVHTSPVCKP